MSTITVNHPKEHPAPTLRQIMAYAHKHKINVTFSEWDSVQMAFERLNGAIKHKLEMQVYEEVMSVEVA